MCYSWSRPLTIDRSSPTFTSSSSPSSSSFSPSSSSFYSSLSKWQDVRKKVSFLLSLSLKASSCIVTHTRHKIEDLEKMTELKLHIHCQWKNTIRVNKQWNALGLILWPYIYSVSFASIRWKFLLALKSRFFFFSNFLWTRWSSWKWTTFKREEECFRKESDRGNKSGREKNLRRNLCEMRFDRRREKESGKEEWRERDFTTAKQSVIMWC